MLCSFTSTRCWTDNLANPMFADNPVTKENVPLTSQLFSDNR